MVRLIMGVKGSGKTKGRFSARRRLIVRFLRGGGSGEDAKELWKMTGKSRLAAALPWGRRKKITGTRLIPNPRDL